MITLTREEAQQVLDAFKVATTHFAKDRQEILAARETLRARLSAPEPEPVAWGVLNTRPTERQTLMMVMIDQPPPSDFVVPLYLAPPQREWQGLMDELRRLHEVNAELVEALEEATEKIADWGAYAGEYFQNKYDLQADIDKAKAALAKATGENND